YHGAGTMPGWPDEPVPAPASTCCDRRIQVAPPSAVATIVPSLPTAQPLFWSAKATALRSLVTCESWACQVAPASADAKIEPRWPTTQASESPMPSIDARSPAWGDISLVGLGPVFA